MNTGIDCAADELEFEIELKVFVFCLSPKNTSFLIRAVSDLKDAVFDEPPDIVFRNLPAGQVFAIEKNLSVIISDGGCADGKAEGGKKGEASDQS